MSTDYNAEQIRKLSFKGLKRMIKENLTINQIAKQCDVHRNTIKDRLKWHGLKIEEIDFEYKLLETKKYIEQNKTIEEIAHLCGVQERTIIRRIKILKLKNKLP